MAKGAYIGVSAVARKVKKMYIGVGGVARKVKKAYIGVGGVARLFWSGESRGSAFNIFETKTSGSVTNASTDNLTSFESCNNKSGYGTRFPVFYKDKYIASFCYNSNAGIYYSTSLTGTWTLAKSTQYTSSGSTYRVCYDLYIYDDVLYAVEQREGNGVGGYMKSTNGTSWTFTGGTSNRWSHYVNGQYTAHKPSYAIYKGNLYVSGGYNIVYVPFSSMSSNTGRLTPTAFYSSSSTQYVITNLAIDAKTNIGYFALNSASGSGTPYYCYTNVYSVDMSTGQTKSQGFASGTSEVWTSSNAYGSLYFHNGVLYACCGGKTTHANGLSVYSEQLSWTAASSSNPNHAYNIRAVIYCLQDKLITLALDGYTYYGSIMSRTNDTYTVLRTQPDATGWYTAAIPRNGIELYNYDVA